jgi:ubiquinone/menaquinone biosynthesis C-methylase UbiE
VTTVAHCYEEQVLPRIIDVLLGNAAMRPVRERSLRPLRGTVLELGFGSGTNIGCFPATVDRVLAVEPSATARSMASRRLARHPVHLDIVGLDGQHLDLPDESVDDALSTWTLCTIPEVITALHEVRRVLRPGGRLVFLEHGRSPDPGIARWQQRLNPLQQRVGGGCTLDRDIPALLAQAGFVVDELTEFDLAGPSVMSHMFAGVASA